MYVTFRLNITGTGHVFAESELMRGISAGIGLPARGEA